MTKVPARAKKAEAAEKPASSGGDAISQRETLQIQRSSEETESEALVRTAASPIARGAMTARVFVKGKFGDTDLSAYVARLAKEAQAVKTGDLGALEAMLAVQASTLDALFNDLAVMGARATHVPAMEGLLRMALKAQAQCANTVKTLGELKNPRQVSFVKQANIAAGHQQVNNGVPAPSVARAHGGNSARANELLEGSNHGQWMESGAPGQAGRGDPAVEAVEAVDRTDVRGGQDRRIAECFEARDAVGREH